MCIQDYTYRLREVQVYAVYRCFLGGKNHAFKCYFIWVLYLKGTTTDFFLIFFNLYFTKHHVIKRYIGILNWKRR
jgi:hypothetical protein